MILICDSTQDKFNHNFYAIIRAMSKKAMDKEQIKAKLEYLKSLIITFLVSLLGIFSYIALHYKEIDFMLGVLIAIGVVALFVILYRLNIAFDKHLNNLGRTNK